MKPLLCPQRKSRRYYPTRLAITLATGVATTSSCIPSANPGAGDAGFIVVETNYRIYAYTGAETHTADGFCLYPDTGLEILSSLKL